MLDLTGPGGTATLESFFFFALGLVNSVAPILIFLALYVSSSYGFVVMVWKESMPRGDPDAGPGRGADRRQHADASPRLSGGETRASASRSTANPPSVSGRSR